MNGFSNTETFFGLMPDTAIDRALDIQEEKAERTADIERDDAPSLHVTESLKIKKVKEDNDE